MPYMTVRQIKHEECLNRLRDLGAKVISVHGVMFLVKFCINDFKISYMYHENPDKTYYLERIRPYIVSAGDFDSEIEVVDAIETDIKQFKNAMQSKNFESFIDVDLNLSNTVRAFDDLFLYYNISKEDISLVTNEIKQLKSLIMDIKDRSKRVYHDKDPKNI